MTVCIQADSRVRRSLTGVRVVRRALRPDEHGAVGVWPRNVREDREHVPRELQAAGGRPAPGRRLAAAMMTRQAARDTTIAHYLHSL